MKIQKLTDKDRWDRFLIKNKASFTQSIDWGKLKEKNQRVGRLEAKKEGELVGVCQFLEEENPLGEYFYIPYGPIGQSVEIRDELLKKVAEIGEKEGKTFIKAEPRQEVSVGQSTPHRIQPKKTLVRSIKEDPEEILQSFKEGTRYSVRYSKRKGVEIRCGKSEDDLDQFFELLNKTEDRQDFQSFSEDYFRNLLSVIDSDLFLAVSEEGEVVASTIFGYFGKVATSLHSAFDYEKRKLRATSLIRYRAMLEAKENGCEKFDAWGIDEEDMPGVTKFKKGFGGREVVYPDAVDIAIKKIKYKAYKTAGKVIK